MSPLQIEICLWYYTRQGDWESPGDFVDEMVEKGLLENNSDATAVYKLTEKGSVYVEALQNMPLPVKRWEIPEYEKMSDAEVQEAKNKWYRDALSGVKNVWPNYAQYGSSLDDLIR